MSDDYAYKLHLSDALRKPVIARAIDELPIDEGDSVLDAGCGVGSHLPLLLDKVGLSGKVMGLDISSELLSRARAGVEAGRREGRVSLVEGDINCLPFEEDAFDCVISVDCAGYPFCQDPTVPMREFKRVIRPGGTLAMLGWTYQQLLPGYPLLESRLNTASSLTLPGEAGLGPEAHFMRAPAWLREAGFTEAGGSSYVGDANAPLSGKEREAILSLFEMLWKNAISRLPHEDRALFRHICDPGSEEFILDRPDYYGFFLYACFTGKA